MHLEPQRLEGAHAKALTPCGLYETPCGTSSVDEMVGHRGYAPRISPIRTARIAIFLMPVTIGRASWYRTRCLLSPGQADSLSSSRSDKWSGERDSHPRPDGSKPPVFAATLPPVYIGSGSGNCAQRAVSGYGSTVRVASLTIYPGFIDIGGGCRLCSDHLLLARQALS